MGGILYLLPVSLGASNWGHYLPAGTREVFCGLTNFIAENAKSARAELARIGHPTPLRNLSIIQLPEKVTPEIANQLLAPLLANHDVGLLSEAGCPAIADPGALIVRHAHLHHIKVRPLVGPSSLLLALMAAGMNGQNFVFHGYLPAREPERGRRIIELEKASEKLNQTQVFIEAPYRNSAIFSAIIGCCRETTRLCLATDLTTDTESITSLTIREWKNEPVPEIARRPTVFLLFSGLSTG